MAKFVKGDPRINRKGRPTKDQMGERKQWQEIFAEYVLDDKGKPIIDEVTGKPLTRLRARMKVATTSRNSHEFALALERAFGKVPQAVEMTGKDGGKVEIVVTYADKRNPADST